MIVCSCNVFSDDDVRGAMAEVTAPVRTAGEVYTWAAALDAAVARGPSSESWPPRSAARTAGGTTPASRLLHPGTPLRSIQRLDLLNRQVLGFQGELMGIDGTRP
jgi:hypothetical protein